jgi:hypothetical protein
MLRRLIRRPRSLLAAAAFVAAVVLLTACYRSPPAPPPTGNRLLLGGLPPEQAARGVYVVDLDRAGELSPGSRLGPLLESVLDDAEVMVETAAPPVTLLGGVSQDVPVPQGGVRQGTTLVFAEPAVAEQVTQRLRDAVEPSVGLGDIADGPEPVRWRGPTPAPAGSGSTTINFSDAEVFIRVEGAGGAVVVDDVWHRLETDGPPGSPGKRWPTLLEQAEVVPEAEGAFRVVARRGDLPGLLLRALIDQQQLTFLSP